MIRAIALIFMASCIWFCCPAYAATQDSLRMSIGAYQQGHVLEAIHILQEAFKVAKSAQERWTIVDLESDICTEAYQYDCIVQNAPAFLSAVKELNDPRITAAKLVYVIAFERYMAGDLPWIEKHFTLDFSAKVADPIRNPILATRLYLLNALIWQHRGNFSAAQEYIHRAFSSLLRINYDTARFTLAVLLSELIDTEAANHDIAGAVRWAATVDPLIRASLPVNGFDYANYLLVSANLYSYVLGQSKNLAIITEAMTRVSKLQINGPLKEYLLSSLSIQKAAFLALQGNVHGAREEMNASPIHARRDQLIKAGKFSSYSELLYATGEIFFDVLDNVEPDGRWKPLFEKLPDWNLSTDVKSNVAVYRTVVLALLDAKTLPGNFRKQIAVAAQERIADFERGLTNGGGFPLPSLLDRIVLGMAIAAVSKDPSASESDLLVKSMELLNRNPRYTVSDSLAAVAAQSNDAKQRIEHSILRISDQQNTWEVDKLKELVARVASHQAFNPKIWTAQLAAIEFDHDIQRLKPYVNQPIEELPTLNNLQSALTDSEAFVGYAIGAFGGTRICIRKNHFWTSPIKINGPQFLQDSKLLRDAMTAGYAPSDELDTQYPVNAAIRVYDDLFDGLSDCFNGATHLIFFPTADATAIPLSALLQQEPPKLGSGYDLSKAHWVLFDFAISYVSSVRNFIAARIVAQRPTGDLQFLGIGDPRLHQRLADGRTAGQELASRSAPINARALTDLSELPDTRIELQRIASLFGPHAKILVGANATEEAFRTLQLERYQILHFATHGLIRGDISGLDEAALVLTPGDPQDPVNDGLLTATEIANLTLRARLAVLSACNTANFDPLVFGTQVQGLATAFAVAGVPTTIASLWPVESGTSMRIMVQFYRHLLGPDSPSVARALQQSIIEAWKSAPSRAFYHPRFWAPFIAMGDGGARLTHSVVHSRAESSVMLQPDGGEIEGGAAVGDDFITSEIGPIYAGRHSSIITMHSGDGHLLWSKENRQLGAGRIIHVGHVNYVASYLWREKSLPVLRAISDSGAELWKVQLKSRFASSWIAALAGGPTGVYVVVAPFAVNDKEYDFDLVHISSTGSQLNQISLTGMKPQTSGIVTYAMARSNGQVFIAANAPAYLDFQNIRRNDFGMSSYCFTGSAAHLYRINAKTLSVEGTTVVPRTKVVMLAPNGGGVLYAGSEHTDCTVGSETAVFGEIGRDLSFHRLWKDDGPFFGQLISVEKQRTGYFAVGQIREPLSVQELKADASGQVSMAPKKHPEFESSTMYEALFIAFDKNGSVQTKEFVGDGLPLFPVGMFKLGMEYAAYGSNGFNPWMGYYH